MATGKSSTGALTGDVIAPLMSADQARAFIVTIRRNTEETWRLIVEFNERQGYKALGYPSWRACIAAEFDVSESHAYHMLTAAKVNLILTASGSKPVKASHAQALAPIADDPGAVVEAHQAVQDQTQGKAKASDYEKAARDRQALDRARLEKKSSNARPSQPSASIRNDRGEQVEMYRCGDCGERVPDGHNCMAESPTCTGCPVHCTGGMP